jgi:hypothetical protein
MSQPVRDAWSALAALWTLKKRRYLFVLPMAAGVAFWAAAFYGFDPRIGRMFPEKFAQFFSTSAQVLAAGLVALVLQVRVFTAPRALVARRVTVLALLFIIIGESAAITGLSPALPDPVLYRWALALTVGAGVAFLLALLLIAIRTLAADATEREEEDLTQLAAAGDPMAARLIKKPTV